MARSPAERIEFVAEAGANGVFGLVMIDEGAEAECERRRFREVAEIRVAVFGPDRPIAGDRIFDAAADGPAGAACRVLIEAWKPSDAGVEAREFGAARRVEQCPVECDAETAANRSLHGNLRVVEHAAGAEVSADARSLDIAFQPGDELVELEIIADMGAADDAVRGEVGAEAERKDGERVGAPSIADLAAEVEAGPGKEWNGRSVDRRRLAGGKVGRECRRDGGQCCRRDEKFANHGWVPFRSSNSSETM